MEDLGYNKISINRWWGKVG